MRTWFYGSVGFVAVAALLGSAAGPGEAAAAPVAGPAAHVESGGTAVSDVARRLRRAMDRLRFQEVLDTAPPGSAQARALPTVDKDAQAAQGRGRLSVADPKPIVQQPQLDATIIELDKHGRPRSSGTVLMSPRYKNGIAVPVDRNLSTGDVRWRQWDDQGWYANGGQGTIDVVPGRERASIDHMLGYPASVLKLMVNFGVLRLVDQGRITLDGIYDYRPSPVSPLCGDATSRTVRQYIDDSLTWSSNGASCALIKLLHDQSAIDPLNETFQQLGLETLQLKGTRPTNGGRWSNEVTMSSLDTAKLLTIVNGGPGRLWTARDGRPVTGAVLSESSRRLFKEKLGQQGLNDMLSTTNWCGGAYPAAGLPQTTPARWVGADGTVTVMGSKFGRDVRPCDKKAEVTFAHKTGWVNNSAGDAGIVKALPGKGGRSYIVVVFSNLGTQYVDANRPPAAPGIYPFSYTEKFAKLGRAIDSYEKNRLHHRG